MLNQMTLGFKTSLLRLTVHQADSIIERLVLRPVWESVHIRSNRDFYRWSVVRSGCSHYVRSSCSHVVPIILSLADCKKSSCELASEHNGRRRSGCHMVLKQISEAEKNKISYWWGTCPSDNNIRPSKIVTKRPLN